MGIGSTKKEVDKNNEFYIEAYGYQLLKVEGLDINKEEIKSSKQLESFNGLNFEEEIIDHAD